ncbi:MAG: archaeosortase/exosortase family protein, partial [Opitutales bacterium]|nr:archaeosortase/exosortase family protein [Opitutales bacterium]
MSSYQPNNWRASCLTLLAIGGCWILAIWQLQTEWTLNPQYAYGWITAPLAFFLIWRDCEHELESAAGKSKGIWIIGILAVISLFPLWIIREANPDWRLLNWLFFIATATISLVWFYTNGGWRRMRLIAFPLFFLMTAIPLLLAWDLQFAQILQRNVSLIVRDILLLLGRDAELEGHLIRLATCTVGV